MNEEFKRERTIYTIGHSKHSTEDFIELLKKYLIEVLVDVRSRPYSKLVPQFNKDNLKASLMANGIKYLFLGKELGGLPDESHYYDTDGYVIYSRIAESEAFRKGISRLENGITKYRVGIMCSEENPSGCHRRLLIGRVLGKQGVTVQHIRSSGDLQTDEDLDGKAQPGKLFGPQPEFVVREGEVEWKSIRSVSQKKRHQNSSGS